MSFFIQRLSVLQLICTRLAVYTAEFPDHIAYIMHNRYAGWGPGQLQSEVERDVWYVAASAKELVLKPVIALPKPLYRKILELMGGEYAETARRVYEGLEGIYGV